MINDMICSIILKNHSGNYVEFQEQRKLLLTMFDAVYVDTVDEKTIVAIRPKPAFQALFEIVTTGAKSGVVLIKETPQALNEPEASSSCFWWRRGRVELPVQKRP